MRNNNLKMIKKKLKLSFIEYIFPYFILKKINRSLILCIYTDIINSYFCIEKFLPIIQKLSQIYIEKNENNNSNIIKYNQIKNINI